MRATVATKTAATKTATTKTAGTKAAASKAAACRRYYSTIKWDINADARRTTLGGWRAAAVAAMKAVHIVCHFLKIISHLALLLLSLPGGRGRR